MGAAMELLTGTATAPGATITAVTMATGNSLTVRNTKLDADIWLLQAWVDSQVGGIFRLRSPQLHDNVQGMRFRHSPSEVDPLLPENSRQKLMPQDTLVMELSGSTIAGDIESACLLLYYSDLPGITARFIDEAQLLTRGKQVLTVENSLALGAAGGYSGEEAINAEFDLLKANTDYAILGYQVDAECAAVRYRGADFGNLGIGGPGNETDKRTTGEWFARLSRLMGTPLIPVFNSANKAGLLLDGVQDENGTDVIVSTILVELGP